MDTHSCHQAILFLPRFLTVWWSGSLGRALFIFPSSSSRKGWSVPSGGLACVSPPRLTIIDAGVAGRWLSATGGERQGDEGRRGRSRAGTQSPGF